MRKKVTSLFIAVVIALTMASPVLAAEHHVLARLHAVNGSHVSGLVNLTQLKKSGTRITVVAFGLHPDTEYVSLYYSNHVCELEPYSVNDVVGGIYTANRVGVGVTQGNADDDLDEINSVSVRLASNFSLLACANVHP